MKPYGIPRNHNVEGDKPSLHKFKEKGGDYHSLNHNAEAKQATRRISAKKARNAQTKEIRQAVKELP